MPSAMPGGFGNFQAGWAQAQQQQLQLQLQQAAAHGAATGGGSQAPQQQQHHMVAVSPFAAAAGQAAGSGQAGMVQPSAVVGDSEVGDKVNGHAGTPDGGVALSRPTPKEFRAQALTKFKQKRKVRVPTDTRASCFATRPTLRLTELDSRVPTCTTPACSSQASSKSTTN